MSDDPYTTDPEILTPIEALRTRPMLYIGPVDQPGAVNVLLKEALSPALDEAYAGRCRRVEIVVRGDGSAIVADDGMGMSLEPTRDGRPGAEILMTEVYAGHDSTILDKIGQRACRVGLAAVNALSAWCRLEIRRDGFHWQQTYHAGKPDSPFQKLSPTTQTGTTITFQPDPVIFQNGDFDVEELRTWFRALKLDLKRASVRLIDERSGSTHPLT